MELILWVAKIVIVATIGKTRGRTILVVISTASAKHLVRRMIGNE